VRNVSLSREGVSVRHSILPERFRVVCTFGVSKSSKPLSFEISRAGHSPQDLSIDDWKGYPKLYFPNQAVLSEHLFMIDFPI
jgi:hypothetical protein